MTARECKVLGIEMAHGSAFHSDMVKREEEVPMVFPVLMMMGRDKIQEMQDRGVVAFWAYMSETFPRSINGYPMFSALRELTKDENKMVIDSYNEEVERMKELTDG